MISISAFAVSSIISFLITLLSIPLVKKLAFKSGFVDRPNPNNPGKIHKKETALLGGLAVILGVIPSAFILENFTIETTTIVLLTIFMFLIGLQDDKKNLDYRIRLIAEFTTASIFAIVVLKLNTFSSIVNIFGFVLAIFWVIGIINAVNMMDNIDGATAGATSISAIALLTIAIYQGNHLSGVLAAALLGSALAFLIFNYSPASIFLGDAGTLSIGFLLASTTAIEVKESIHSFSPEVFAFPFILGFPIYDTTFATIRRVALKKPIYVGGESNITYRLISSKIDKQKVIFIEYGLQAFFCIVALCMLWGNIYIYSIAIILGIAIPLIIGRRLF
jgi:UDP-GlcNAc:undecaprenyl-phosphate GlcNAc-1-phosphate transferase